MQKSKYLNDYSKIVNYFEDLITKESIYGGAITLFAHYCLHP